MPKDYSLRRAVKEDHADLYSLLDDEYCLQHRHLDWHSPYDWLGHQPFWLLIKDSKIAAALSCPADPPNIAWVRLFAISRYLRHLPTWDILFQKVVEDYRLQPSVMLASIALRKWYSDLLQEAGFKIHQQIVVLAWQGRPSKPGPNPSITIRDMLPGDLVEVQKIDRQTFEPIWQNSLDVITRSYKLSNYATVIEFEGKMVGFQISSSTFDNGHLARLAVLPTYQNKGLGRSLVNDLLFHLYRNLDVQRITVNTQNDNPASLTLYERLGFRLTGDRFPVYLLNRDNL